VILNGYLRAECFRFLLFSLHFIIKTSINQLINSSSTMVSSARYLISTVALLCIIASSASATALKEDNVHSIDSRVGRYSMNAAPVGEGNLNTAVRKVTVKQSIERKVRKCQRDCKGKGKSCKKQCSKMGCGFCNTFYKRCGKKCLKKRYKVLRNNCADKCRRWLKGCKSPYKC